MIAWTFQGKFIQNVLVSALGFEEGTDHRITERFGWEWTLKTI